MDEPRTIDEELATSIQAAATRSGIRMEVGDVLGRKIHLSVVPASDVVPTYRVRGEIAREQGLILHGFDGFMAALSKASGQIAVGSLKIGSFVHILLMDPSAGAMLSWVAIERPVEKG